MTYQFKHVEHHTVMSVAQDLDTCFATMLDHMGPKRQAIETLLQEGKLQGPDIDLYRNQVLPSVLDPMHYHLTEMRRQVHELLRGDGQRPTVTHADFWSDPPPPAQSGDADHPSAAPALRGHGYADWREAIIEAALQEIHGTWAEQANTWWQEAQLAIASAPEQALEGAFNTVTGSHVTIIEQARNDIMQVNQAVRDAPWRAMMEGLANANPETWSIPVLGGLFDLQNLISGVSRVLDQAQYRLGALDSQAQQGFQNIMDQHMKGWPNLIPQSMTAGAGSGLRFPGAPGFGPLPGTGNSGSGTGGGNGSGGGTGGGGGGGGTGDGTGTGTPPFPPPTIATTWADNQPDQFPQPQNLEDVARELIRRQGGRHHLLLITHFGPPDQNNWLVTIPDRGNDNFTQDPGDPGGYSDNFGASAATGASSVTSLTGTTGGAAPATSDAYSAQAADGAGTSTSAGQSADSVAGADAYLNNAQAIRTELAGRLSPYGQFVAEALQKYCTSQPPDAGAAGSTATPGALMDGGIGSVLAGALSAAGHAKAPRLTCPPTSPQNPALIWLAGHGLGGMVAQNLAGQKPFPGDNPNLAPAHVIKSVMGFGAPIIGKYVAGVAYDFFRMPGDRVGDIPVDTVGVNDERARHVHALKNPFLAPPWQTTDPHQPNYIKDPNDPQMIHNAYADSDELAHTKLPFDILGHGGAWGPTYVVRIPQATASATGGRIAPLSGSADGGQPISGAAPTGASA